MNKMPPVSRRTYAGLFLVTLATLMYEILLTRIFSVTMWYHFAFMAVSIAMFGMTVGAVTVYLLPGRFAADGVRRQLTWNAITFCASIVVTFLIHLHIPFLPGKGLIGTFWLVITYAVISVPFVFSGICVALALTRFTAQISKLYTADLAGAAVGCILLIQVLKITDGPTAVFFVAALAGLGAAFWAADQICIRTVWTARGLTLALLAFACVHTVMVSRGQPFVMLTQAKTVHVGVSLYEKWNSFSRIVVNGDPDETRLPFGWGLSSTIPRDFTTRELGLYIDAAAGTHLTAFDGDLEKVRHLKYDVTNIAHYIRPNSRVLVIGTGGGRDILSALVFNQKAVLGIEINENIIDAVNGKFGDFTGHLDKNPKVTIVNDEARSYIARTDKQFDIVQISLIDTWAATAAGAFALTENSLYTVEAWNLFLKRLSPTGVLSVSRWYFADKPGEVYRLASLASQSLRECGIKSPANHVIIVKYPQNGSNDFTGVGTILLSKTPFTKQDLKVIDDVARRMKFGVVLSPERSTDGTFRTITSGRDLTKFYDTFPLHISPPTDDKPFFFNMLRIRDVFNPKVWDQGSMTMNLSAVRVLGKLLITMLILTLLCVFVPLALTSRKDTLRGSLPLVIFFACIGIGFMLVEISQMQRLTVMLGHPTYGLSVVLFSLLLSSGFGSYFTQRVTERRYHLCMLVLLFVLVVFGALTPYLIREFQDGTTALRIAAAVIVLLPLGFVMGMAFPLGMKVASGRSAELTPWLWGINGATSVCASVLAVVISMHSGISSSFWTGVASYAAAFAAFIWATGGNRD